METPAGPQGSDRRSSQELFRDLWSQALVTVGAAEEEVKKLLERLGDALDPQDVQRYRRELADRLRTQRKDLERSVEEGIRRALGRLRVPSREELESLRAKVEELGERLDRLAQRKAPGGKR